MPFQETEIKNFLGISTRRTPQINECADCSNIELREKEGDILSAANPILLKDSDGATIAKPNFASQLFTWAADLGFTTHVFSQLPASNPATKEVVFYFQRGTITDGTNVFNHIAIGMYPNYVGGV
jgi:hypothetical protein